jgi:serine/threonine protein kinase
MLYHQSNVLIDDDGVPRLSDFGQSKFVDHKGFTTPLAVSARYTAPELMETHYGSLTYETDVFAFSMLALEVSDSHFEICLSLWILCRSICMTPLWLLTFHDLLQILTGKLPYFDVNDKVAIMQIVDGIRPERSKYLPTIFTDSMWAILVQCWDQRPDYRPGIWDVVTRLERMWLIFFPLVYRYGWLSSIHLESLLFCRLLFQAPAIP